VSVSVAWFRHCCVLLLACLAIVPLNVGCCHSANSPTNSNSSGGVASANAKSWSLFGSPEPKKVQTPSDFINQPRPQ
jgi:hypothetical protein